MKKISKLFIGFSIPTISLCFVPLTSCNKDTINVKFEKGEHITLAEVEGEARINQEFKIKCTLGDAGWKKISSSNTYIKVGNEKLIIDRHYSIDNNTIWIYSNVIKSNDITVHIEAEATITSINYIWSSSCKKVHTDYALFAVPDQILTTNDLKIVGQFGDGPRDIECGTETGQYQIYHKDGPLSEEVDITSTFKSDGYKFTAEEAAEGPNQVRLGYKFKDGLGFDITHDILVSCGNAPTKLAIKNTETEIGLGEQVVLECTPTDSSGGSKAYSLANFEIVTTGTIATDAKIVYNEKGEPCLQAGETEGTVIVKATSLFDTKVVAPNKTFTIKKAE